MGRIYKNGINYSGGIVPSSDAGVYINNLYLSNVNSDVATYKTLSYEIDAVETEMSLTLNASQGEQLGGVYLYPVGIGVTNIDAGVWSSDFTAKVSSTAGGSTSARVECFLRHTNGTETVLFTKTSEPITATEYTLVTTQSIRQVFTTDISDRIGFKIYATTTRPQDTTISYIVGDGRGSHFSIPLPLRHSQLRAKDEETAYQHITSTQKTEMLNPTFTEATTLANVNSGESNATLWGKVKKMFSFIGTTTLTTTAQTITTAINELKNSIGNTAIQVNNLTSVGSNNYTQSYTITKAGYYILVSAIRCIGGTPVLPNQISVYATDSNSGDFIGGTAYISQYSWNTITTVEYLSVGTHVRTFKTGTSFTSVEIRSIIKLIP